MPDTYPTLMDVARRSGDKSAVEIVEVLNKTNQALDDIPWVKCNSGVVHKTTTRTSIPTPGWRKLNSGVPTLTSTTSQFTVSCGMLEGYSNVDVDQVKLAADGIVDDAAANAAIANALKGENEAFIEGFGQESARVMFYGDPSKPQEPLGLTHWYSTSSSTNVIHGGGSGSDNTSIWLIAWDKNAVFGIYPAGSIGGLHEKFLGEQTVEDANGNHFQAYRTHYKWDQGYCIRDIRCAARVCNIDWSNLTTSDAADLADLMVSALYKLPRFAREGYRKAFYMRPELFEILDKQTRRTQNLHLNYSDVFGREILTFRGVPVREQESLLNSEAGVV